MKSKVRHTPETITVYPINKERLDISINKHFHDGGEPMATDYHTQGKLALIREPKPCIIDDEFVSHDISDKIIFYIFETTDRVHNMLPTYEVTVSTAELEKYLDSPVTLADFTKDRRGYNTRIRANEADWIRHFNK